MICEKFTNVTCRLANFGSWAAMVCRRILHCQARAGVCCLALMLFVTCALAGPPPVTAQEAVVVKSDDLKPYQDVVRGIKDACGCKIREVRLRDFNGLQKALEKNSDAVVAIGTAAFKKVKTARDRPVVYAMVMPSETASPLPPNISGVSMDISPNAYLFAMLDVFPGLRRIGLLYDPRHTAAFAAEAAKAAQAAGLDLVTAQVRDPRDVPRSIEDMRGKIDLFWMLPDATVVTPGTVEFLLRFSFQQNLPVFSFSRKYVEMGAVASLDVDPHDMGVQAGELIKGLTAGRTAAKRMYARAWHLTVNRNVAAKMGYAIHPGIMTKGGTVE